MSTNDLSLKIEGLIREKSRTENEFRRTLSSFSREMVKDIVISFFYSKEAKNLSLQN